MALGIALLLVAGGVAWVALRLDSYLNANRDWIAEQVESNLGRPVRFGEVGVSLWGGLGVRVRDLKVGDDPAFSSEDFLEVGEVQVGVSVLSALMGNYQVSRVVLRRPSLTLIRTAQGLNIERLGAPAEAGAPDEAEEAESDRVQLGALVVALVDVEEGRVRFVDRTAKPPLVLDAEALDFSASNVRLDAPVRIDFAAAVLGASRQNATLSGTVGPIDLARTERSPLDLRLSVDPVPVGALAQRPDLAAALPPEFSGAGALSVKVEIEGTLEKLALRGSVDATDAALSWGESFHKPEGVPLRLDFSGAHAAGAILIQSADLKVTDASLAASGTVATAVPTYELKVESRALPLAGWDRLLPALEGIEVGGDARLELHAVAAAGGAQPRVSFSLASDDVRAAAEGGEPVELRDVAVDGTVRIGKGGPLLQAEARSPRGTLQGAEYRDLSASLRFRGGRATLEGLSASVFGGELRSRGSFDLNDPENPAFDFDFELKGVRAEQVVASQLPAAVPFVRGQLGGDLALQGSGRDWAAIKRALTGAGTLLLDEGTLVGVNLGETALSGLTGVTGLSNLIPPRLRADYPQLFDTSDTVFDALEAHVEIRGGRLRTRDLQLAARDYAMSADGSVSLDGDVDFSAQLTTSEELGRSLIAQVRQLQYLATRAGRVEIPVHIGGRIPDVAVQPDLGYVAQAVARSVVSDLVSDALGMPREAPPESGEGDAEKSEPPPAVDPAEELIRRGLEGLLGR